MRVLVAMSGGVDSAVAAALLQQQGREVVGVTMLLYDDDAPRPGGRGCCGSQAVRDAQRVAARLKFPHYTWDFRAEFEADVIRDFCAQYGQGRTPNPCLRCNERIKFAALLDRAGQLGADCVATGHHARIEPAAGGRWRLCRGRDERKDQTYFLYGMTQAQMARVLMPVGELTKDDVRRTARELDLAVADKPESQEICFVPGDDYVTFLRRRDPALFRPGPVLDTAGRDVGRHDGIAGFTLGQRRGLGLAFGERRYVVGIDAGRNAVILGAESDAYRSVLEAAGLNWVSGEAPAGPARVRAKVRYQGRGGDAVVEPRGADRVRVVFDEPQWAPTPGQAVVFWQGDCVLGGGTIETASRE